MAAGRACAWCGADISGRRADALYCCLQHKKNAGSKRHRQRNPSYYRKYHGSAARVAWLEANRDRVRAAAREQMARYRAEHPDVAREWWAANPDKHRLYQAHRRTAKLQGGTFLVTDRDIKRLLDRYRGMCAYCATASATTLDHVIPLKLGGRHSIGNLVPACKSCNSRKGARLAFFWNVTRLLTNYADSLAA